jgi:hypothetical protein
MGSKFLTSLGLISPVPVNPTEADGCVGFDSSCWCWQIEVFLLRLLQEELIFGRVILVPHMENSCNWYFKAQLGKLKQKV